MMNKLAKTTILVAALTVSGLALANPYMGNGHDGQPCTGRHDSGMHKSRFGGMDDRMIEHMTKTLDLTDQQRDDMRALIDANKPAFRKIRDNMQANRKSLRALQQSGDVSDAEVRKLADQQGSYVADMIMLRAKVETGIDKILTDTQRQQLKQLREHRREHWQDRS